MLLRRSIREEYAEKLSENEARLIQGKSQRFAHEELRRLWQEMFAEVEISNSRIERLIGDEPLIIDHSTKERGVVKIDADSTILREAAAGFQMKSTSDIFGIDFSEVAKSYKNLGEARGKFTVEGALLEHTPENIPLWRNAKVRLSSVWQNFLSGIYHRRDRERAAEAVSVYHWEINKHIDRYADPHIAELAIVIRRLGFTPVIATQNLVAYVYPVLRSLGFETVIGNHLPKFRDEKVIFPPSSQAPLKIITAADKHSAFKRMRSFLSRTFSRDELKEADFSSSSEIDGFQSVCKNPYDIPQFGVNKEFLVESTGEYAGDVVHTLIGMFKPSDFDGAFLIKEGEKPFSKSGPLGRAVNDALAKEKTKIIEVSNTREISRYLANTSVCMEQQLSLGMDEHINDLQAKGGIVDPERLQYVLEELRSKRELCKWVAEDIERRLEIKLDHNAIFGPRKIENPYPIRGISNHIPPYKAKAALLKKTPTEPLLAQRVLVEDLDGTIDLIEYSDRKRANKTPEQLLELFRKDF